ncbi:MAG: PAS domain-containing sensor histidine kinase [Selenomonadaceae bacterium]
MEKEIPFRYESLKMLLGDIGDGIVLTDTSERVRYANEAACRILGATDEASIEGALFYDVCPLINVGTGEKYPDPLPIAMYGMTSVGLAKDVGLMRGERPVYLSATCSPMRSASGRLIGCSIILREVTRLRMLEHKIAADQKYMTTVFSAAKIGLCVLDANGYTRKINGAGLAMMQTTAENALGRQFGDAFLCENSIEHGCGNSSFCPSCPVRQSIEHAIADDEFSSDFTFVMKSKRSYTPMWLKVFVSQTGTGDEKRLVIALIDISAGKLYEKQLKYAKTAAEAASKAKTIFISNISHEIRTPINGMLGMLELAERSTISDKVRNYIENARSCSEDLLAIINDILDFSKLESGRMKLESIGFDTREMFSRIEAVYSELARKKGIAFSIVGAESLPRFVVGDPLRIRQIFRNLLTNALKFTQHGKIEITASTGLWEGRPFMRFTVSDTGIGMERKTQEQLFQPFSQGDSSITRRFGGTGLGLMIVKELIAAMQGDIAVESEKGKGSKFIFRLPLIEADGAEPEMRRDTVFMKPDIHGESNKTAEDKDAPSISEKDEEGGVRKKMGSISEISIDDLMKYCNDKLEGDEK